VANDATSVRQCTVTIGEITSVQRQAVRATVKVEEVLVGQSPFLLVVALLRLHVRHTALHLYTVGTHP